MKEPPQVQTRTPAPQVVAKKAVVAAPTKAREAPRPSGKLEGNQVEFVVENGMAIAFGDIVLGNPEREDVARGIFVAPTPQLWDRSEIPYSIDPKLPNPERVKEAIAYFQSNTPVKFVPYQGQPDAIVFAPGNDNCYSMLGRQGGMQPIYLNGACTWNHITHELMHALGFIHEHSRTDRDQYVKVVYENIDIKYQPQFNIVPDSFMETVRDSPFDFQSIMLYEKNAFARLSDLLTLIPLSRAAIQPAKFGLSALDRQRLNKFYRK